MHLPNKLLLLLLMLLAGAVGCESADRSTEVEPAAPAEYIHPSFTLTIEDLHGITADIRPPQREAILQRPQVFLDLVDRALDLPFEYTVLVDKEYGLAADFVPAGLVSLNEYPTLKTARNDLSLMAAVMPKVLALDEAARQDGIELVYASTYRSYRYQQGLFATWVERLGQEQAERVSARPGHSQHQLGTVIDFSPISQVFSGTQDYAWLKANAHRFGFSLSYPYGKEDITGYDYESWHWRYIGHDGVRLQREFFEDLQQWYLEFLHYNRERLEQARRGSQ
ncbi:M15 family metallopeptidase [Spirochaeta africana]|uniref:D-alanyl-D-alanine carboxypeptidase n=1 Tax=Spirochaeta africana (strain ATCC 700263 / DSM 8902 / Z-7692) TaxID=889378 RepID=H9UJ08_SPIAZ|nr:M15 family metallopeptidase [Spirochaeta africana]AFG37501.1 D-alanyl-D-alanine carboxypeptidase [Spirochaeta africana DSM 8902]